MNNPVMLRVSFLVFCFFIAAPIYLHFTPGALSPDSLTILSQARSGVFEDAHPPLMAAIWRLVDYFLSGSVGMLILNLSLFYGGVYLVFIWAAPRYNVWIFPAAAVVGLYPPIIGILGVIWIDITMAGLYLLSIGVFLNGNQLQLQKSRAGMLFLALLIVAMGIGIRHNAAAAALPIIALMLLQFFYVKGTALRRFTAAFFSGLLVTFLIFVIVKQISAGWVDKQQHFWRVAALYDIAGVSCGKKANLFYGDVIKKNSLQNICQLYTPRSLTPLLLGKQVHASAGALMYEGIAVEIDSLNVDLNDRLLSNWLSVIVGEPVFYLIHRYQVFHSLITRSQWGLWAPVFDAVYANDLGIPERVNGNSNYFSFVRVLAYKSIIFVPALYLLLSALLVVPVLIIGMRHKNNVMLLASVLYASGLTHMIGLFFMAASADFRYSHWMISVTTLATSLIMLELIHVTCKHFPKLKR